ncbi:MAG: cytochrome C [Rhodospirillaceae bacterium]|nr:MAG: cytochrome C [Rhodospirillaceae bacterium]
MKTTSKVFLAGLAVFALAACSDNFQTADATNNAAVAAGGKLYLNNCASCHGEDLKGEPDWRVAKADGTLPAPPHDDSGHTWHHPDTLLFNYTKGGGTSIAPEGFKSNMPAYKDILSDSEIWATLSYIKSRWSIQSQARQARMNKTP